MKFTKKTIYICLFAILYLIVAFSSLYHAVEFFGLANNSWMAIILAFAFEVGQAAVLFALLTSPKDRGKVMPWVLMTMFTLVQVLGNVYSSYKHIINNSTENLRYFKEPIFIWTQLPDDQATVIITYLVGGLLPVSALLLTSMVTNYLGNSETDLNKNIEIIEDENKKDNEGNTENNNKKDNNIVIKDEEIPQEDEEIIDNVDKEENIDDVVSDEGEKNPEIKSGEDNQLIDTEDIVQHNEETVKEENIKDVEQEDMIENTETNKDHIEEEIPDTTELETTEISEENENAEKEPVKSHFINL